MNINSIIKNLTESVIDFQHDKLDPRIFKDDDNIKPEVRHQILKGAKEIHDKEKVVSVYIVGSGITYNYTDSSDIDVNVELKRNISDESYQDLVEFVRSDLNEVNAVGSQHPINYFIVREPFADWKADAIYDLMSERWLKKPTKVSFDVQEYMDSFRRTVSDIDVAKGELRRDIIDFNIVRSFKRSDMKKIKQYLEDKLKELEIDLEAIVEQYRNIVDLRHLAFDQYTDLSELDKVKYGTPNKLPANVIYKLLERFYYLDFLKHISQFLRDVDWKLKPDDVDELISILDHERV